jgi:site-specific DNA-methyltransferase (adenine-specific)
MINWSDKITVTNEDNMQLMARYPDGWFDLAIVDPEFGIGIGNSPRLVTDKGLKSKQWDNKPIDMNYFDELFRISKNQIIWGGNYYALPPNKHCIIWDKKQPEKLSFGMFDYAWTSFDGANKIFRKSVQDEKDKIHPTQKPVALYKWLLDRYAKQGDKILDTHLGSGSIAIACHDYGFELTACELDAEYYEAAKKRFFNHKAQTNLFL